MPQYAAFDPAAPQPAPVIGWYDTTAVPNVMLPLSGSLVTLTTEQWETHFSGSWGVSGGALVAYTAPVLAPTLAQQAAAASVGGLTIALSGSISLAATLFPTDAATQTKLGAVITTINGTGAFPGGVTSYPMKDASGTWHTFTVAQYKGVAGAIGAYVAALDLIADGYPLDASALPAASASLAV